MSNLFIKYGAMKHVRAVPVEPEPTENPYVIFENEDANEISVTPKWTQSDVEIEYSLNGTDWSSATSETEIEDTTGNQIYFRGKAPTLKTLFTASALTNAWLCPDTTKITGNLNFLLCDNFGDATAPTTLDDFAFAGLFYNCTSLATAPALPATTLGDSCYRNMLRATALTEAPSLPATTLADSCYSNMFRGCTSLDTAPSLPATTLGDSCYSLMFFGCTSLDTPPSLPATTLADGCYLQMFLGCTSLDTPPSLPATTLAVNCYNRMFQDCTSLDTAPSLPATTLANSCYAFMFQNCSAFKVSASEEGDYIHEWRIPTSGTGTTATSWNTSMLASTGGTFTDDPEINTIYYVENAPV